MRVFFEVLHHNGGSNFQKDVVAYVPSGGDIDLTMDERAQEALTTLDNALDKLNTSRASVGSKHNRLTSAMDELTGRSANLESAESNIRDADFAHETAKLARNNIMQQATQAILAQAHDLPQMMLRLSG